MVTFINRPQPRPCVSPKCWEHEYERAGEVPLLSPEWDAGELTPADLARIEASYTFQGERDE